MPITIFPSFPLPSLSNGLSSSSPFNSKTLKKRYLNSRVRVSTMLPPPKSLPVPELAGLPAAAVDLVLSSPPTWNSAIATNLLIFLFGSPLLVLGLLASGIRAALLLGILTWRAFGPPGFLLVAAYFVIGTAATKVKITQKEALGVAEQRRGRRGPGSVVGSSAAGCVCALLSIYNIGGAAFAGFWHLGFVASFCTKLSDTVSSEIGKAYGKSVNPFLRNNVSFF